MPFSDDAQGKLILYRGFPPCQRYTWSPFVTKLEFRLRHSNIPYILAEGSTQEGPFGKIPYVDIATLTNKSADQADAKELVGDSTVIVKTLIRKGFAQDLNADLSPEQKVADIGIRSLYEDKLYFYGMAERWLDNYYIHRDHILQSKPWVLRVVIGNLIYKKIVETVHLQGCGRFTKEEQKRSRQEIWQTLEHILAQRQREASSRQGPFWVLGGENPTEADAVLFGFVNSVLVCKSCPQSQAFVKRCSSLMEFARRIHEEYFPDYEKWED